MGITWPRPPQLGHTCENENGPWSTAIEPLPWHSGHVWGEVPGAAPDPWQVEQVASARSEDVLLIDGAITAGGASVDLVETIAKAGPFGAGNPEPVLALPAHTIVFADIVAEKHVRVRLRAGDGSTVNAIAFRAAGQPLGKALIDNRGRAVHAAAFLAADRWQGERRVQLRLIDVAIVQ